MAGTGGLNDARQRHPSVPSSNQPPVSEWANSFWYMIRIAALQANVGLDDNAAAHIVNFMASMAVVIPCPDCRRDFAKDWVLDPFTMHHAKSAERAVAWVEDLRRKVERHVEEQRKAKGIVLPPNAVSLLPPALAPHQLPGALEEAGAEAGADAGDEDDSADGEALGEAAEGFVDEVADAAAAAAASAVAAAAGPGPSFQGSATQRARTAAASASAAAAAAAATRPRFLAQALLGPMPPRRRRALASVLRASAGPAHVPSTMAEDGTHPAGRPNPAAAQLRTFALRTALQVTAANNGGRRMGCACPAGKGVRK